MAWEFGVSRCKLLYIEWKSSKVLSTGNCIQYPVINYNEKGYETECVYGYFYCAAEINTTL